MEDKKIHAIYTLFEEEIDAGNYYTHEQALAEIKTWKSKSV